MPSEYAKDISEIKTNVAVLVQRSTNIEANLAKLNGTLKEIDDQVDDNRQDIAHLQERQGVLAGINTGLSIVAATIAAWIGVQR